MLVWIKISFGVIILFVADRKVCVFIEVQRIHRFYITKSVIHYIDIIMRAMASQITSLTIDYLTIYSGPHQRKHESFVAQAFVQGIPRWPVNSAHKRASNRENVSIWWRHHALWILHWILGIMMISSTPIWKCSGFPETGIFVILQLMWMDKMRFRAYRERKW